MRLINFNEKQFIEEVLGPMASTAAGENFDDAVIIDLAELTGQPEAPFLVYSIDQPSFVRHADSNFDAFRYYGRWIAGVTCNDIIAMGGRCRGFSLALTAPLDTEVANVQSLALGITDVLDLLGSKYEGGNLDRGPVSTVGLAWRLKILPARSRKSFCRASESSVLVCAHRDKAPPSKISSRISVRLIQ